MFEAFKKREPLQGPPKIVPPVLKWGREAMASRLVGCLVLLLPASAIAGGPSAWQEYEALLAKQCPQRHVDRIADGQYPDLLDAYERGLSSTMRKSILAHADIKSKCASERMGFACEVGYSLEAYRQLGLLRNFTSYSCHKIRCEDYGICSHFPQIAR